MEQVILQSSDVKSESPMARKQMPNKEEQGDPNEPGTFLDVKGSEAKLAAYLSFSDTGSFRRALLSYPAIRACLVWTQVDHVRAASVLKVLKDCGDDSETFPEDMDIFEKYPVDINTSRDGNSKAAKNEHKCYAVAMALVRLIKEFHEFEDTPEDIRVSKQSMAYAEFKRSFPDFHLPEFDIQSVKTPRFGPLDGYDESVVEKYNRAFQFIRVFKSWTQPKTWSTKFKHGRDNFKAISCIDAIPAWMTKSSTEEQTKLETSKLIPKEFKVTWERHKGPQAAAVEEHLTDRLSELSILEPEEHQVVHQDPRLYTGGEGKGELFFDSLRRQYECKLLGLQIDKIRLQVTSDGRTITHGLFNYGNKTKVWEDILPILDSEDPESLEFIILMRKLRDGEEVFKSKLPPLQMTQIFEHAVKQIEDFASGREMVKREESQKSDDWISEAVKTFQKKPTHTGNPGKPRDPCKGEAEILRDYDNFDAFTKEGILGWQKKTMKKITGEQQESLPVDSSMSGQDHRTFKELGHTQMIALLSKEGEEKETDPNDNNDDDEDSKLNADYDDDYQEIERAFAGSKHQHGPIISLAILIMGMELHETDDHGRRRYRCSPLGDEVSQTFFEHQITGAMDTLIKTFGEVPSGDHLEQLEHFQRPEVAAALQATKQPCICHHINTDGVGMGKTIQTLLALSWAIKFAPDRDGSGKIFHRPHFLITPGSVTTQWAGEVYDHWKIFNLVIACGEKTDYPHRLRKCVRTKSEVAQFFDPNAPTFKKSFLQDQTASSSTIFLINFTTYYTRCVTKIPVEWKEVPFNPPQYDNDGNELKKRMVQKFNYDHPERGLFRFVIIDEAHRIRYPNTLTHKSMAALEPSHIWCITATPIVNNPADFLGYAKLFWPRLSEALNAEDPEVFKDMMSCMPTSQKLGSPVKIWDKIEKEEDTKGVRRRFAMNPAVLSLLFSRVSDAITLVQHKKYFHCVAELCILHRTGASKLKLSNEEGNELDLSTMMKPHLVTLASLELDEEEKPEYQLLHLIHASQYSRNVMSLAQSDLPKMKTQTQSDEGDADESTAQDIARRINAPLRHLEILSLSTLLARFVYSNKLMAKNILKEILEKYESSEFGADWFINLIWRKGDLICETRAQRLKFLCWGSPTLRYLFHIIRTQILPSKRLEKKRKLLVTEAVPLSAWYIEMVLQYGHVEAETLHAGLCQRERDDLIARFNDEESKLQVLIITYSVMAQGINLHNACNTVFVATAARNPALEVQGWGRVIRITQKHDVKIIRKITEGTHDIFLNGRQAEKAVFELASRATDPEVRRLILKVLNDSQPHVRRIQQSQDGQRVREIREAYNQTKKSKMTTSETSQPHDKPKKKNGKQNSGVPTNDTAKKSKARFGQTRRNSSLEDLMAEKGVELILLREKLRDLPRDIRSSFRFDDWAIWKLLDIDPDRPYVEADLENRTILERGLRLLYLRRLGRPNDLIAGSIDVKYDALPAILQAKMGPSFSVPSGEKKRYPSPELDALREESEIPEKRARTKSEEKDEA